MSKTISGTDEGEIRHQSKSIRYIVTDSGCWECVSHSVGSHGYPQIRRNMPHQTTMHRYVYELLTKKIDTNMFLLHRCDNKLCINPDHLFEGTHQDNMEDMDRKGRRRVSTDMGELCSNVKLEEEDIHEIRYLHSLGYSQTFLGNAYGCDKTNVSLIVNNKTWRHI